LTQSDNTPALVITNLQKTYDNGFQALKGIDLRVEKGDFFALLGPNGAGKSTAIGIICSLVKKTAGSVTVFDADIDSDFARAKSYLGVVPQEFNFSIFETPLQIIVNQAGYYGINRSLATERAEEQLNLLGLWEKRNEITQRLSGGMKRRLMIARALVHEPQLLILDEPTAGVDIEIRRSMWGFLARLNADKGVTIILTTHYLEEVESLCRNIAIIDQGRLVENTSIRRLLMQLQKQTYVLDIQQPLERLPGELKAGWHLRDSSTIEVELPADQDVNDLFAALNPHGIKVMSMRNKTNRLEQLFMNIVDQGKLESAL
jgi:ABC-2 type transport system ATP-binding protein